mmetsp:Transcript_133240/g.259398  ORF Transcript_133240/g.259398 Transcript_133240/m.259398 type:complete len:88 (-) Transcript_133240:229-492(-)
MAGMGHARTVRQRIAVATCKFALGASPHRTEERLLIKGGAEGSACMQRLYCRCAKEKRTTKEISVDSSCYMEVLIVSSMSSKRVRPV